MPSAYFIKNLLSKHPEFDKLKKVFIKSFKIMSKYNWKFFDYKTGEPKKDSSSDKHFKNLDINQALIRELIQNSLDAVKDKEKSVEVKIRE